MFKQLILYGISTGINRGTIILYLPFILSVLSTSEYGIYSLIIITSQLIIPILSLNGSSAILREGSEEVSKGLYLLYKYIIITIFITSLLFLFVYISPSVAWISYIVLLAGLEALHQLFLTYLRCNNKAWTYLVIVVVKVFGLLGIFISFQDYEITLNQLLLIQLLWYFFIFMYMVVNLFYWKYILKIKLYKISLIKVLPYSLLLIPHGISQWIISSSDRYIIKAILGNLELGIYSIAYSLAMILMLVNSGIALSLPTHFIKNYERWTKGNLRSYTIKIYSIVTTVLFMLLLIFIYVDSRYFSLLNHHNEIGYILTFTWVGLYFLGIYLFYTNYLYYYKKSMALAKQTILVALFNIILTIIFTYKYGIEGAALATAISYGIYLILIIFSVGKIEPRIMNNIYKDLKSVPFVILFCFVFGYIYTKVIF